VLTLLLPGSDTAPADATVLRAAVGGRQLLLCGTPDDVSDAVDALTAGGWLLSAALRLDDQLWQVQLRQRASDTSD